MILRFVEHLTRGQFSQLKTDATLKGTDLYTKEIINTIVFNPAQQQTVIIDEVRYSFPSNCILPLVNNQHFVFEFPQQLVAWQFNREFYCIVDHDAEVGCVGFLFYGIHQPLFLRLDEDEVSQLHHMELMIAQDMQVKDTMQGEMLRTHLKRMIIFITRIAKKQTAELGRLDQAELDIVRKFNLLLEKNFRTQHSVQFYADALFKSPKTLSNLFALSNYPPPSKIIQQRVIQEAKRYLYYTDKTAKEIAYLLGFTGPGHFSKFFRQHSGFNITDFRNKK